MFFKTLKNSSEMAYNGLKQLGNSNNRGDLQSIFSEITESLMGFAKANTQREPEAKHKM